MIDMFSVGLICMIIAIIIAVAYFFRDMDQKDDVFLTAGSAFVILSVVCFAVSAGIEPMVVEYVDDVNDACERAMPLEDMYLGYEGFDDTRVLCRYANGSTGEIYTKMVTR